VQILGHWEVPGLLLCLLGLIVVDIGYIAWDGRLPAFEGIAGDRLMDSIMVLLLSGGTLCGAGFRELIVQREERSAAATDANRPKTRGLLAIAVFVLLLVAQMLLVNLIGW
jgi:hypothetical protein